MNKNEGFLCVLNDDYIIIEVLENAGRFWEVLVRSTQRPQTCTRVHSREYGIKLARVMTDICKEQGWTIGSLSPI